MKVMMVMMVMEGRTGLGDTMAKVGIFVCIYMYVTLLCSASSAGGDRGKMGVGECIAWALLCDCGMAAALIHTYIPRQCII